MDDATAEAASAAFDMAVMRLRKLLTVPEAVVIEDGKMGLDPDRVWLDLWAFDRDVDALRPLLRHAEDDGAVAAIGERRLALYRGPFLDHEEPQRWLLAARERTRQRFLRSLSDAGSYWERRERWSEAATLYERGLEIRSPRTSTADSSAVILPSGILPRPRELFSAVGRCC